MDRDFADLEAEGSYEYRSVIEDINLIRSCLPVYARDTYAGRTKAQLDFLHRSIPADVLKKLDRRVLAIGSVGVRF